MKGSAHDFLNARLVGTSSLWRGMMKMAPLLKNYMSWSIGNGKDTLFWSHKWIENLDCLSNFAITNLSDHDKCKVVSYYTINGHWNLTALHAILPEDIFQSILATHPPRINGRKDYCFWNLTPSGKFSLRSLLTIFAGDD